MSKKNYNENFVNTIRGIRYLKNIGDQIKVFDTDSTHAVFAEISFREEQYLAKKWFNFDLTRGENPILSEYYGTTVAATMGLAIFPIYLDYKNKILWIKKITFEKIDLNTREKLDIRIGLAHQLSKATKVKNSNMKELHVNVLEDIAFDLSYLKKHPNSVNKTHVSLTVQGQIDYFFTKIQMDKSLQANLLTEKIIISHNDICEGNVVKLKGKYVLIDFETSGLTPISFMYAQIFFDILLEDGEGNTRKRLNELLNMFSVKISDYSDADWQHIIIRMLERSLQNAFYGMAKINESDDRQYIISKKIIIRKSLYLWKELYSYWRKHYDKSIY